MARHMGRFFRRACFPSEHCRSHAAGDSTLQQFSETAPCPKPMASGRKRFIVVGSRIRRHCRAGPANWDDGQQLDDEDGVVLPSPIRAGQLASVEVTSSFAGFLAAWADFTSA